MLIALLLQIVCFGFIMYKIKEYQDVFHGLLDKIQLNKKGESTQLKAEQQSKAINQSLTKINEIIAAKTRNKFYTTTLDFDEITEKNVVYINNKVISQMLIHIALFLISIIFIAAQVVDLSVFFSLQSEASSFKGLSSFGSMYMLILIIAFLFMSLEWMYWLRVKSSLEEDRVSFLSYLDNQFQEFGSDNIRQVLSNFSLTLEDLNKSLENNNKTFRANLKKLNGSVETQIKNVGIHAAYLDKLEELNLNKFLEENAKLYPEMKKSMNLAAEHFPMFGRLSEVLNETINRSITLYRQLNDAIKRDQDFSKNLSEFEYGIKHNGHVTTKLMETLNDVNTHFNQVATIHGPKIQELDKEFFEYLEKRLYTLRNALEKNDTQLFELLGSYKKEEKTDLSEIEKNYKKAYYKSGSKGMIKNKVSANNPFAIWEIRFKINQKEGEYFPNIEKSKMLIQNIEGILTPMSEVINKYEIPNPQSLQIIKNGKVRKKANGWQVIELVKVKLQ